ncbi:MAG TPA: putative 2OG-Fe(II) oxygenase [Allosphingosinicella sp.]
MTAEVRQMLQRAAASRDADAMLRAGAAALQAGAHDEAVAPVGVLLKDHPGNARLWQLLGLLHRNADDLKAAIEALAKAAELAPDDAMIANALACATFEAGLPAVGLFERAVRLAPSDRSILLRLTAARIQDGEAEAALGALADALRRDPQWVEGHAALARVRWTRGDHEHFADSFEHALAAAPRDFALWRAYIETLLHDQLFARALPLIERARAAAGRNVSFDAAEAIARSELGETERPGPLFARLAQLGSVPVIMHHIRFFLRTGRVKEAAAMAERAAPRDPSHQLWPYVSLGWRLLGDPRWEWLEGDPRLVGVYDIADRLPPLEGLAERLRALHRTSHHPFDQSLRGGTQTEGHLFSRIEPEIRALRQAVGKAVEMHVAQLPPPQPGHPTLVARRGPIGFSGSWSVRLTGGGRHVNHVHPAGWFSSALYVAVPDAADRGAAEAGWLSLGEASELGVDLPPLRLVEPKPGRLVLFPSTMWHGTRPFDAGERLTVAFDVKRPA